MPTTDNTNGLLTPIDIVTAETEFDLEEMYRKKLYEQQAQMLKKVLANPPILAQMPTAVHTKAPYLPRTKTMIRVPVTDGTHGSYRTDGVQIGSLEMASGTEGDYVEFTLLINGRQSQPFFIHRKELEALTNELQLGRLSK